MKKIKLISLIVLSITVAISCVTTTEIGLNRDFHKGKFTIGKTTKNDVVNFLGLPQKMIKGKKGTVRYIYVGEALITSVNTGGPGEGHVGWLSAGSNRDEVENGAKYTFNRNGILIKKIEPKIESE